jgi:hypothetical protein
MAYKNISTEGKNFLLKIINKHNNLFVNTDLTYTKEEYYDNLIAWVEKYAKEYDLDSNILMAQIFTESAFKPGVYNVNPSTKRINAMGLTQFLLISINDVIFGRFGSEFTQAEKDAISNGITLNSKGFIPGTKRTELLSNIANNPEIMVKAQCVYMKKAVADRIKSDLASICLYCYNRGPGFIKESYGDTILTYVNKGLDPKLKKKPYKEPPTYQSPPTEGTAYVKKIFDLLKTYFGYKDLDNTIDYDKLGFGNS